MQAFRGDILPPSSWLKVKAICPAVPLVLGQKTTPRKNPTNYYFGIIGNLIEIFFNFVYNNY
jgi:hypothetical protein